MEKIYLKLLFILFSGLLLAGCNGSKSLAKKASKLDAAGLYSDAAQLYYESVLRNRTNVDARIGLTKTGQMVLNDKLGKFFQYHQSDEDKDAVYAFLDAERYQNQLKNVGITAEIPNYYFNDFEEVKTKYVTHLYELGNELLASKRFEEANKALDELNKLMPDFKDAKELKAISTCEPLYISGNEMLESKKYRSAYHKFQEISRVSPNYKDVNDLINEALELGRFTMSVVPFENKTRIRGIENSVQSYLVNQLSQMNDPFFRIVERENLELILQEQQLALSGMVDERSAAEVGSLIGAKALLSGTVINYLESPGKLVETTHRGFESYQVKMHNKEDDTYYYQTKYKPVTYKEYNQSHQAKVSLQYKIISLETGEILLSQIAEYTAEDALNFASYEGETTRLLPAKGDLVNTHNASVKALQNQLRGKRTIKSLAELSEEAKKKATQKAVNEIAQFLQAYE